MKRYLLLFLISGIPSVSAGAAIENERTSPVSATPDPRIDHPTDHRKTPCSDRESEKQQLTPTIVPRWPTRTTVVRRVTDATDERDFVISLKDEETPSKQFSVRYYFPTAARFEWPGFDRSGALLPYDCLMIYEGMVVELYQNGNYKVMYEVESPLTEVTVRMQLHFQTPEGQTGTITLAPLHIHEDREDDVNITSQTWQVEQQGNSILVKRAFSELNVAIATYQETNRLSPSALQPPLTRTGTTRFGVIPTR